MIAVGVTLKHTSPNNWTAEIISINEEENSIRMILRSETGGTWEEYWNLAHTESGLRSGEYKQVLLG